MHTTDARCARLPDAPWTLSRSFSWYCTCTCQEVKKIVSVKSRPPLVYHTLSCTCASVGHLKNSLCHAVAVLEMRTPVRILFPENCHRQTGGKCLPLPLSFVLVTAVVLSSCITQGWKCSMPCFFPPVNYYFCVFLCIFHRRSRENKLIMPYVFVSFFLHSPAVHKRVGSLKSSEHILRQRNGWQPPRLLLIYLKPIETQKMVVYFDPQSWLSVFHKVHHRKWHKPLKFAVHSNVAGLWRKAQWISLVPHIYYWKRNRPYIRHRATQRHAIWTVLRKSHSLTREVA